jgi:hypothetical protein
MKNLYELSESLLNSFGVEKMIDLVCNLSEKELAKIIKA